MEKKQNTGSKKLSTWMKRRKLNQETFASRVEVTQESVSRYLTGKSRPRPEIAMRIQAATNGWVRLQDWFKAA